MGNMPILINFENRPLLEISFFKKVPVTRHNIDFRWDFFQIHVYHIYWPQKTPGSPKKVDLPYPNRVGQIYTFLHIAIGLDVFLGQKV